MEERSILNEQPIITDEYSMVVDFASPDTKDNSIIMLVSDDGQCCMCYNMSTLEKLNLTEEQKMILKNIVMGTQVAFSIGGSDEETMLLNMDKLEKELLLHNRSNNNKSNSKKNWEKKNYYD